MSAIGSTKGLLCISTDRCTIRVCQNVWCRTRGLIHLLIIRLGMICCWSVSRNITNTLRSERKRKRRELHNAKRYKKRLVIKHFLFQLSFHNLGVKLVNCLFLLVVATISSQNFQLREKDDPKDENPLDIHPREVSRSECVFARILLFLDWLLLRKWRQD